jgi:hypothetical protein
MKRYRATPQAMRVTINVTTPPTGPNCLKAVKMPHMKQKTEAQPAMLMPGIRNSSTSIRTIPAIISITIKNVSIS